MSVIKFLLKFIGAAFKDVVKNGVGGGFLNRVVTNVICRSTTPRPTGRTTTG